MVGGFFSKRKNRSIHPVKQITVIPVGPVEEPIIDSLVSGLPKVFGITVEKGSPIGRPHYAYNEKRRQYLVEAILLKLAQIRDSVGGRVLGVTEVDMYRQEGRAVFGHADRGKKVAAVSIRRLQDEYYGLSGNVEKLKERVLKEGIRQLGYTYGLEGCSNPLCAMFHKHRLFDLDIGRPFLCPTCKQAIP
jgi:archaemetzincin